MKGDKPMSKGAKWLLSLLRKINEVGRRRCWQLRSWASQHSKRRPKGTFNVRMKWHVRRWMIDCTNVSCLESAITLNCLIERRTKWRNEWNKSAEAENTLEREVEEYDDFTKFHVS
ncbi:MAG: hypothetical protein ACTS6G_02850 [Candidatus Hodgkinia cicadicola]